jgi:hypothetical protein
MMTHYSSTSKRFFVICLIIFKGCMGRIKEKKSLNTVSLRRRLELPVCLQVHPCGRYRHNTVVFILAKDYGLKNLRTIHRLDRWDNISRSVLYSGYMYFAIRTGYSILFQRGSGSSFLFSGDRDPDPGILLSCF